MLDFNDKTPHEFATQTKSQILKSNPWQTANYNSLLNHQGLLKSVKRNVWSYELKSLLKEFIDDIPDLKQNLKFKVSGKILDSSTYVLKTKTNTIINSTVETNEDLKEAKTDNLENIQRDNDNNEIYDSLNKKKEDKLSREERVNQALNLDISDLNTRISSKIKQLNVPPKLIYKKIGLKDLADALNDVLNKKTTAKQIRKPKDKLIDKSKLPFLPENLIASAEKKRANFEDRITEFINNLKKQYTNKPISFLKLINQPTPQSIVEALLCVLHLINHKKIELWKICNEDDNNLNENMPENSGRNLFLSPKR